MSEVGKPVVNDLIVANMLWLRPAGCRGPYARMALDRLAKELIDTVEFGQAKIKGWGHQSVADRFIYKLMGWDENDL